MILLQSLIDLGGEIIECVQFGCVFARDCGRLREIPVEPERLCGHLRGIDGQSFGLGIPGLTQVVTGAVDIRLRPRGKLLRFGDKGVEAGCFGGFRLQLGHQRGDGGVVLGLVGFLNGGQSILRRGGLGKKPRLPGHQIGGTRILRGGLLEKFPHPGDVPGFAACAICGMRAAAAFTRLSASWRARFKSAGMVCSFDRAAKA